MLLALLNRKGRSEGRQFRALCSGKRRSISVMCALHSHGGIDIGVAFSLLWESITTNCAPVPCKGHGRTSVRRMPFASLSLSASRGMSYGATRLARSRPAPCIQIRDAGCGLEFEVVPRRPRQERELKRQKGVRYVFGLRSSLPTCSDGTYSTRKFSRTHLIPSIHLHVWIGSTLGSVAAVAFLDGSDVGRHASGEVWEDVRDSGISTGIACGEKAGESRTRVGKENGRAGEVGERACRMRV
ncbi:hypothetical protein B0I35DRAFT_437074 [Stachybotrys elegans]|uniref:Uncharacterized protein n=1 Tax=Stachybotrys elegans TaxID=80388 RepID=A0A8K0SKV7_9HYPO|nr:hypothetical protein B0I35DRAFT_437074 [Stachybotrys elegans]